MNALIYPSKLEGTISAPPSKSYTHRAIIIASLSCGKSTIRNPLLSDDTLCTIDACRKLGAKIKIKKNILEIEGMKGSLTKRDTPTEIFCGLSGTTLRLITAVAALSRSQVIIKGERQLHKRPIIELLQALKKLGIKIESNKLPIRLQGGSIKGGKITISGNISSQFVSALLLIAPFAKSDLTIQVENLHSAPYIDITIHLMKTFGISVQKKNNAYIVKSGQMYNGRIYNVEGDYSSASYFLAAATITQSRLKIENLNIDSVQGDKYILSIIKRMDSKLLPNIDVDLGNHPDIVPTVSILAAFRKGTSVIRNIGHLRFKESNRIESLTQELKKMNITTASKNDSLIIEGGNPKGTIIETHNDHRIAMSFAIAGLAAEGKTVIKNAEVVNKSYPDFWKDIQKLGAKVKLI